MSNKGTYSGSKVARYLRRCQFSSCFGLSHDDYETVYHCLVLWDLVITDTLPKRHPALRNWHSWLFSQKTIALEQLAKDLETLADAKASAFEVRSLEGLSTSSDLTGLVSVFKPLIARFLEKQDWLEAYRMHQVIEFPRRLSVGPGDLTATIDSWLKARSDIRPVSDPSLSRWTALLSSPDIGDFVPFHSNGATVECRRSDPYWTRGKYLRYDSSLERCFNEIVNYGNQRFGKIVRTSHGETVPKTILKRRFISLESTSLQWAQHGVANMLICAIDRSPVYRDMINLRRAERNKMLAQRGSVGGDYATVDLSSASDSVSHSLVVSMLPEWLHYLEATRSTRIRLPGGQVLRQKTFAPMGSACCFPVETTVFASICLAAAGDSRYSKFFRVYGDDIVCPVWIVDDLIDCLTDLGFHVNFQKSFTKNWVNGCFRESCGGDFYAGVDITPARISRRFKILSRIKNWSDRVANGLQWSVVANAVSGNARRYAYLQLHDTLGSKAYKIIRSYRPDKFLCTPTYPGIGTGTYTYDKNFQTYVQKGFWFCDDLQENSDDSKQVFDYYQSLAKMNLRKSADPLLTPYGGIPTGKTKLRRVTAFEADLL